MTTLRTAYFYPQTGGIALYVSEDGFARTQPLLLTSLPPEQTAIADAAMQWLAAMLPGGMQALTQVILTRNADTPTAWSEAILDASGNVVTQPQPTAWSPSFSIISTGNGVNAQGKKQETTITLQSTPGAVTDATAALWDYLASNL